MSQRPGERQRECVYVCMHVTMAKARVLATVAGLSAVADSAPARAGVLANKAAQHSETLAPWPQLWQGGGMASSDSQHSSFCQGKSSPAAL